MLPSSRWLNRWQIRVFAQYQGPLHAAESPFSRMHSASQNTARYEAMGVPKYGPGDGSLENPRGVPRRGARAEVYASVPEKHSVRSSACHVRSRSSTSSINCEGGRGSFPAAVAARKLSLRSTHIVFLRSVLPRLLRPERERRRARASEEDGEEGPAAGSHREWSSRAVAETLRRLEEN